MKAKELLNNLKIFEGLDGEKELVIACERENALSGQNCTPVDYVTAGFDWYNGKLLIIPKEKLKIVEAKKL